VVPNLNIQGGIEDFSVQNANPSSLAKPRQRHPSSHPLPQALVVMPRVLSEQQAAQSAQHQSVVLQHLYLVLQPEALQYLSMVLPHLCWAALMALLVMN
jgi:hypothetical protein